MDTKQFQVRAAKQDAVNAMAAMISHYQQQVADLQRYQSDMLACLGMDKLLEAAKVCNFAVHHVSINTHPRLDLLATAQAKLTVAAGGEG